MMSGSPEAEDANRRGEPGRLFVYGTLREGGGAPSAVRRALVRGARRIGAARLGGTLYDAGGFPAAVPAPEGGREGGGTIRGEVYDLERPEAVLRVLDRYEGVADGGGLFRRRTASVRLESERVVDAWVYVFGGPATRLPVVPSGDWLAYVTET